MTALRTQTTDGNHASGGAYAAGESRRVFRNSDYVLFAVLTCVIGAAVAQFFAYWFRVETWVTFPATFAAMTVLIGGALASNLLQWFLLPLMRRPRPAAAPNGLRVAVATSFVPGAEPLDMLEQTVQALTAMDYPHDTWVLDEGDDPAVQAMCERLGARHFSRKGVARYQTASGTFQSRTKHGNYNAWLHEVGFDRYEIVSAFDPDHVPDPGFLRAVLGYFGNPAIGYVQSAQAYYNQGASFIARGAAEETYAYYSSLQMASYAMGYPIVTGCHNTHRVSALRMVGGFAAHDADDLLITQFYRASGWQGVYVPEILARGLTPVDWSSYLLQQRRWARSVLDIKFRIFPGLSARLPAKTRLIGFLHGLNYLQEGMLAFASLAVLAVTLAAGSASALSYLFGVELVVLYLGLQFGNFYRQRFYLGGRSEWGVHWRAGVLRFAKWPYLLAAVLDVIRGRRVPYVVTPKVRLSGSRRCGLWPHLLSAVVLAAAWAAGAACGHVTHVSVHIWTGVMVAACLALVATEFMNAPDPYDGRLWAAMQVQRQPHGPPARASITPRM